MFARKLVWNISYNQSPVRDYSTILPMLKMEHVSTSRYRDSGKNDRQCAFFYVRVFAHTYRSLPLSTCYRRHKQEKKRAYDQDTEHGCFSPLVFSVSKCLSGVQKAGIRDRLPSITIRIVRQLRGNTNEMGGGAQITL